MKRKLNSETAEPPNSEGVIKAIVTENNGEISCSVEETNRIRKLLGLKPLVLNTDKPEENDESKAVSNFHSQKNQEKKLQEELAIQESIDKAKEKRLRKEKLKGVSLSEAVDSEEQALLSAADWVKRSRIKEKTAVVTKPISSSSNSNSKYEANELKGLEVLHDTTDFEMGEEVILTLADVPIINIDGRKVLGINRENDVLENINLTENQKRVDRERQLKRLKQPIYTAYDDSEFAEISHNGVSGKKSILAQYDKEVKSGPKMVVSEQGIVVDSANGSKNMSVGFISDSADSTSIAQNSQELGQRSTSVEISLKSNLQEIKEFYSTEEYYATFSKPKEKKKRKIRKATVTDTDPADESTAAVIDNENNSNSIAVDKNGSKSNTEYMNNAIMTVGDDDDVDIRNSLTRIKRLDMAGTLNNGGGPEDRAGRIVQEQINKVKHLLPVVPLQLPLTLNGTESQSKKDQNGAGVYVSADDSVVLRQVVHQQDLGNSDELQFDEIDAEGRRTDGSLVFTSTTEFTTRLQAQLNEKARSKAEAAVKAAAESKDYNLNDVTGETVERTRKSLLQNQKNTKSSSSSSSSSGGQWLEINNHNYDEDDDIDGAGMNVDENEKDDDNDYDDNDEDEEDKGNGSNDEQLGFVYNQPLASKGMAAALALLKGSGELNQKDELAGRAKDSRTIDPSSKDFSVKLEYRDENGRKLTQKEAFRQLSYRFHGYGPGKKKKEKRMKAIEQQAKISKGALEGGGTMKSLVKTQEATGKAHVVVQGGSATAAQISQLQNSQSVKNKVAKTIASKGDGTKSTITSGTSSMANLKTY